jgi:hypothetical protein
MHLANRNSSGWKIRLMAVESRRVRGLGGGSVSLWYTAGPADSPVVGAVLLNRLVVENPSPDDCPSAYGT